MAVEEQVAPDTARDAYDSLAGMVSEFAVWVHGRALTVQDLHDLTVIAPGGVVTHLIGEFEHALRAEEAKAQEEAKR